MLFFYIMDRGYFHCDVRSEVKESAKNQNIIVDLSELRLFAKYEENLQGK
jgi:hypothetical protein